MAVHDWTRVDAGIFHAFHLRWLGRLQDALNGGIMPPNYYALAEQHATAKGRRRTLAIRHVSGHTLVALLEVISPSNKDRADSVNEFVTKLVTALECGIHVLFVDLFPPGRCDAHRLHNEILQRLEKRRSAYKVPKREPLTLASYSAGPVIRMFIEHVAVGAALPQMPLFFLPDRYVDVPLEATYDQAFHGMPAYWREVLD